MAAATVHAAGRMDAREQKGLDMRIKGRMQYSWLLPFGADILAIVAAYYTTLFLRFHSTAGGCVYDLLARLFGSEEAAPVGVSLERFYLQSGMRIVLIVAVVVCALYALNGLYAGRRFIFRRAEGWGILLSNLAALLVFYAYFYITRNIFHPRSLFASLLALNACYALLFRRLGRDWLAGLRARWGFDVRPVVLVGQGAGAEAIKRHSETCAPDGLTVAACVSRAVDEPFEQYLASIRAAVRAHDAAVIVVADTELSVAQIMVLLDMGAELAVAVKVLSSELRVLTDIAGQPADRVLGVPLVHFDAARNDGRLGLVRRAVTFVVAGAGVLLTAPVMVVIGLLIRMTSHGPALFVQERIGVNRKPFRMYKFRTMHDKAEEMQAQIEEFSEQRDVALFKLPQDPRVTPVGRFLRRYSLDELPQLINVVKGEMALVGPRPLPRRDFENYYEDWHYSRHGGLPGLTCLWQVSGRSDLGFHDMCLLDVYYLHNHTWVLDLKIALRTLWVVLFARGAY
jgi:exopolysaccharide biosynthesis polyprenyl glycosylphosphotransferase